MKGTNPSGGAEWGESGRAETWGSTVSACRRRVKETEMARAMHATARKNCSSGGEGGDAAGWASATA